MCVCVCVCVGAAADCSEKLIVTWRDILTRKVHRHYFAMSSYYHIKNLPGRSAIADPDERLAAEVTEVTKKLTMVVSMHSTS